MMTEIRVVLPCCPGSVSLFLSFGHACSMHEFLVQGSNPNHSNDDDAGFSINLTSRATRELPRF